MTDRPPLSVVVPTKNSARWLRGCLESVRAQTVRVELIVIDNFSEDATPAIARDLADIFEQSGPERSAQRNRGAELAHGAWLLFIDSDMVLSPTVAEDVCAAMDGADDALVVPESVTGTGLWARSRSLEKRAYRCDPAMEAARAFRTERFREAGGYDVDLTGPEDWELPDRLRRRGGSIGRIGSELCHDEEGLTLRVAFNKKRHYGRCAVRYVTNARSPGASRRVVRIGLLRTLARELRHQPAAVAGLVLLKGVELSGITAGYLWPGKHQASMAVCRQAQAPGTC